MVDPEIIQRGQGSDYNFLIFLKVSKYYSIVINIFYGYFKRFLQIYTNAYTGTNFFIKKIPISYFVHMYFNSMLRINV